MLYSRATDEWTVALVKASVGEIYNGNDGREHNNSHEAGCDGTSCDGSSSDGPSSGRLEHGVQKRGCRCTQVGSNKPLKYDEEGGFDLYEAVLESYLAQRGCWVILDGTDALDASPTAAETARQSEKNTFARDVLLRGVLIKDATKICTMTDARQMWVAFELEKTKRNFSNALFARKKFYSYDYAAGMGVDEYLDEMKSMRRQLHSMNDIITDDEMVKVILQGVACAYRGVVRMFEKEVRDGTFCCGPIY
ncbi:hypothetical protein PC110_g439 [Phytophthora cactorum]|uniref:Uncharacterized protein n=2 Tax=Phytophthora cactorum TaxID=29920 RepID=A0A329T1N2_9STRA|nr:hypothetical protein PC110_g439 [Phytophthora cactorum]